MTKAKQTKLKEAFRSQRHRANDRGIEFLFSFEEWFEIWESSGKLPLRGRGRGRYCMARFGDIGPYSRDNVEIILHSNNSRLAHLGKKWNKEQRDRKRVQMLGVSYGPHSATTKLKIGLANRGKLAGARNPKAKLTEELVTQIFLDQRRTGLLVQQHNMSRTQIQRIRAGTVWGSFTKDLVRS